MHVSVIFFSSDIYEYWNSLYFQITDKALKIRIGPVRAQVVVGFRVAQQELLAASDELWLHWKYHLLQRLGR